MGQIICQSVKEIKPDFSSAMLMDLSVKKFRAMLNKKSLSSCQIFQVGTRCPVSDLRFEEKHDDILNMLLEMFKSVFKSEVSRRLLSRRSTEHDGG